MGYKQRVGLSGWTTYTFIEPHQVKVLYKSLTKSIQRNIDLRILNPNPMEQKIIAFRVIILGLLFIVMAFVFGGSGYNVAPTFEGKIGWVMAGIICALAASTLFYMAYLRSRHIKAFLNILTGRAEIVLYLGSANHDELDRFTRELISRIAAAQNLSKTPTDPVTSFSQPRTIN